MPLPLMPERCHVPARCHADLRSCGATLHFKRVGQLAAVLISFVVHAVLMPPANRSVAHAQQPADRPRVGLALGGGAARGLAHVGVLEWLEEHRIPVDAIAGTGIGGLVGGGYATGRSADEVRAVVGDIDWDRMFLGEVEYGQKSFRRKEDRRGYPVRPEFGLRGGLRLVASLDPGHAVELLLSRIALPYAAPLEFDALPIPFRAVAADLEAATVVELGSGSLASALRATMSVPGVFQPVERDGLLLADGALLNNVPADVVSRMGVDVVIAVDASEPLGTREDLQSLVSVANQALGVMMVERTRGVLDRHADHVITPELDEVLAFDWREFDTIRALGYEAAAAAGGALAYLALSPAEWERHIDERRARRTPSLVEPQFVRVEGVHDQAADEVSRAVEPMLGTELDPNELDLRLTRLAGRGRLGALGYDLLRDGDRMGIGIRARDKPHGPPFLNLGVGVENVEDSVEDSVTDMEMSVGTRVTVLDAGTRDAELRFDLALGRDRGARLEHYLPVAGSRMFVAPRVEWHSRRQRVSVVGKPMAGYRTRRTRFGADLGVAFGVASELRAGYEAAMVDASRLPDVDGMEHCLPDIDGMKHCLGNIDGLEHGARVRWVYDGQDHWLVPRSGTRIETEARWLVAAPEQPSGFAQAPFTQARFTSSTFLPLGREGRVFLSMVGSMASGDPDDRLSPFYQSTLGGPFRLGVFERDQFRGVRTGYAGAGYLHRLGRMPDLFGGSIFAGAWLESGWVDNDGGVPTAGPADICPNVSVGLLVDTLVGALFASASFAHGERRRFHIALRPSIVVAAVVEWSTAVPIAMCGGGPVRAVRKSAGATTSRSCPIQPWPHIERRHAAVDDAPAAGTRNHETSTALMNCVAEVLQLPRSAAPLLDIPQLGDVQQIPRSARALLHGDEVVYGGHEERALIDRHRDRPPFELVERIAFPYQQVDLGAAVTGVEVEGQHTLLPPPATDVLDVADPFDRLRDAGTGAE